MSLVPRDTWIGIVMLAVAAIYWHEAGKIRISPLDGPVGAAGLPKSLAYALGFLALILILRSIAAMVMARRAEPRPTVEDVKEGLNVHARAAGMLLIGVGYLLVLPFLGYAVSIGLLLGGVSLYIGAAPNLKTGLVAVLGAVIFYILFVRFLGIPLPSGMFANMLTSAGR